MQTMLADRARDAVMGQDHVLSALQRYADEIGVSVDHVIAAALQMVAEDYLAATGNGMIPVLR